MKNKLGYLALLGFIGILGFFTDNKGLLFFFAFFVFFRYFFVKADELFKLNVQKAATPAFFAGVGVQALTIFITAITNSRTQLIVGWSLSFSVSIMVFILILVIFEFREYKEN